MSRTHFLITACLSIGVAIAMPAGAQSAALGAAPHLIVVRLVDRPGSNQFAFEPTNFTAQHGDTLRFVQASVAMHNVHFKTQPAGANLGRAVTSRYLSARWWSVLAFSWAPGRWDTGPSSAPFRKPE